MKTRWRMKESHAALECEGLTKRFGGLVAVNGINLRIRAGERRAIIGPNGAGKTTLFSLISGLLFFILPFSLAAVEVYRFSNHRPWWRPFQRPAWTKSVLLIDGSGAASGTG